MKQAEKSKPKFQKLLKGYLGFLEGTGKSLATIGSYKGDLGLLEAFLRERKKDFYALQERDFGAYLVWLEKQGLKTNTRRRKILSAKALVRYAVSRKKLAPSSIQFVKAPERLERLPWIPLPEEWSQVSARLQGKTPLGLRNALLVQLLAETGLTVAELVALQWRNVGEAFLEVEGKRSRKVPVSSKASAWLQDWRGQHQGKFLFPGFNRHGITSERMTTRGIELYFRQLAKETGFRHLKPKTLRHFAVASWLREGLAEEEIQKRLGVHKSYSLDAYRKHLETR